MKKNKVYSLFLSSVFLLSVPIISTFFMGEKKDNLKEVSDNNLIDQHIEKGYQFDEGEAAAVTTDQEGYDHLYMWGDNSYKQLGSMYGNPYFEDSTNKNLATKNYFYAPQELAITKDHKGKITDVKSTKFNTIVSFVDQDGNFSLYIYGSNRNGLLTEDQLFINLADPIYYNIPSNLRISDAALTDDNIYILLDEKGGNKQYLYSWGLNNYGQLGLGFSDNYIHKTPHVSRYVNGLSTDYYDIESIYAQNDALYLVVDNNEYQTVYTIGSNSYSQLGNGVSEESSEYTLIPTEITFFNHIKADQIFIDGNNNNGVYAQYQKDNDTYIVSWGNNIKKQLVNIDQNIINQPTAVFGNEIGQAGDPIYNKDQKNLLFSEFGYEQSFLIYQTNDQYQLYGWGINNHYSLGLNNNTQYTDQTLIKSVLINDYQDYEIKSISTGSHSTDLLIEDNNNNQILYTWGYNQTGQLGNGEVASLRSEVNTSAYIPLQTYFENGENNNYYQLPLAIFIVIMVILILVLISLYISVKRYRKIAAPLLNEKEQKIDIKQEIINELSNELESSQELVDELSNSELTAKNTDLNSD